MAADVVGGLAVRDLPDDLARVQVDGGDAPPGRADDGNAVHVEPEAAAGRAPAGGGAGPAHDVVHVRAPRIADEAQRVDLGLRVDVEDAGLGVERPPGPVRAAGQGGDVQGAEGALPGGDRRRRVERADAVRRNRLLGAPAQLGREVDQVVDADPLPVERRRPGRERLGGRGRLAGHVRLRHGPLVDGPHRFAGGAVEHVEERLLAGLRERLDVAPVDGEVDEDGGAGQVEVPDVVVNRLEVPDPLAGLEVEGDDAVREQVVAGPVPAVEVAGRHLHREVHVAQLGVDGHLAPYPGVPGVAPRIVQPGVVPEFVGARNGVEYPLPLAGPDVVAPDVPGRFLLRGGRHPGQVGGADYDDPVGGDGRRVQPDLAGDGVDVLVEALLQVDHAAGAEARRPAAGAGVQRDQAVAGGDVEDHPVAAVVPVRQAAPREPPRRPRAPLALVEPVRPQQLAGGRVEGGGGAARAGGRVEHAVDHERGRLEDVLRARAEVLGAEPPRRFQGAEVAGVDLVQGGVAGVAEVSPVGRPLAAGSAVLGRGGDGENARHGDQQGEDGAASWRAGRAAGGAGRRRSPGEAGDCTC